MSGKLKTSGCVTAIGCIVFLFVLSPMARSADKTTWSKFDNSVPGLADSGAMNGRIPLGTTGKGDDYYTYPGSVIKDDATYKMWYSGCDQTTWRIYYATSPDGLNWAKYDNNAPGPSDSICTNGTIALGSAGQGDSKNAYFPSVIKDGATYKMWYTGDIGGTCRIYYATSPDGLTWTKYDNSIPDDSDTTSTNGRIPLGTSETGDEKFAFQPAVVKVGSTYKMWYAGRDGGNTGRIYHATSTDGLAWTKYSNSIPDASNTTGTEGRIPLGTGGGDTKYIDAPGVILDDSCYRMWYRGYGGTKYCIYNATSSNGLTWTKVTNAVPDDSDTTSTLGRIPLGDTAGRGDKVYVSLPKVIKDGATYKMWYAGQDGSKWRTYHATSTDSLNWSKVDNTVPDASDQPGNGRIPRGTGGKGDDVHVAYQAVIKDGSTYKMWYSGHDGSKYRIYYATSPDGMIWVKYNNTVPDASNTTGTDGRIPLGTSGGDVNGAVSPSVIKDDSIYMMWYAGADASSIWRIYHATSSNGLTWTKYTNAVPDTSDTTNWGKGRIPLGTSGGDVIRTTVPSVIKDGSLYKMWYTGLDATNFRIYYATSPDALMWTKYDNSVPADSDTTSTNGRIPLGTTNKGDENGALYQTVIKDGSFYKMWYSGRDVAGSTFRIYYATSTDGLTWKKYDNSIPDASDTISTNGRIPLGITGGDILYVYAPCVIKDGYFYKMWYAGHDGTNVRIYHATLDQLPKGMIFYSH